MATRVTIKKTLEAKIRGADSTEKALLVVGELVKLLDDTQKRAAGSTPGIGYKELVALFRLHLGSRLAMPPNPSAGYIVRVVNRAKEQGIDSTNVEQICRGLLHSGRPPYDLWYIVNRASEHFQRGDSVVHSGVSGRRDDLYVQGTEGEYSSNVYSGRPALDED